METLVSIETAAQHLGISPWTVRAWVQDGRILSAKLGSRRLVPSSEIQRLVTEGVRQGRDNSDSHD